jgi:hypothetical protein
MFLAPLVGHSEFDCRDSETIMQRHMFSRKTSVLYSTSGCRLFMTIEYNFYMHIEENLHLSDELLVCCI